MVHSRIFKASARQKLDHGIHGLLYNMQLILRAPCIRVRLKTSCNCKLQLVSFENKNPIFILEIWISKNNERGLHEVELDIQTTQLCN